MDFLGTAIKVFDLDEGKGKPNRLGQPYQDTKGNWTIGRGHYIGQSIYDLKLSENIINEIFFEDLNRCAREASLVLGRELYYRLEPARKFAVLTLFFTMGAEKIEQQFDDTMEAIKRQDWENVAARVFTWKWARDVDPKQIPGKGRDDRISYMFKTGKFHPDYKIEE